MVAGAGVASRSVLYASMITGCEAEARASRLGHVEGLDARSVTRVVRGALLRRTQTSA